MRYVQALLLHMGKTADQLCLGRLCNSASEKGILFFLFDGLRQNLLLHVLITQRKQNVNNNIRVQANSYRFPVVFSNAFLFNMRSTRAQTGPLSIWIFINETETNKQTLFGVCEWRFSKAAKYIEHHLCTKRRRQETSALRQQTGDTSTKILECVIFTVGCFTKSTTKPLTDS